MTHRDIRPGNFLLDANWDLEGVSKSFERLLNKNEGEDAATYGKASDLTEVLPIGPIYYILLHGHEP